MDYHGKNAAVVYTQRDPTSFIVTVCLVINRNLIRITKDCSCTVKRDAVLLLVRNRFVEVPLEIIVQLRVSVTPNRFTRRSRILSCNGKIARRGDAVQPFGGGDGAQHRFTQYVGGQRADHADLSHGLAER